MCPRRFERNLFPDRRRRQQLPGQFGRAVELDALVGEDRDGVEHLVQVVHGVVSSVRLRPSGQQIVPQVLGEVCDHALILPPA